jgi:hypothetical protein
VLRQHHDVNYLSGSLVLSMCCECVANALLTHFSEALVLSFGRKLEMLRHQAVAIVAPQILK